MCCVDAANLDVAPCMGPSSALAVSHVRALLGKQRNVQTEPPLITRANSGSQILNTLANSAAIGVARGAMRDTDKAKLNACVCAWSRVVTRAEPTVKPS